MSRKLKDWCSGFPDRSSMGYDWSSCCQQHDKDYEEGILTRREADQKLCECVKEHRSPIVARIMYIGVRLFGGFGNRYNKDGT